MTLRRVLVTLVLMAAAVGGACTKDSPTAPKGTGTDTTGKGGGDTTTTTPPDTAAGTFTLTTINALALPFTINSDTSGYLLEITAGTALLQSNGKFIMSITQRETLTGIPPNIYVDSSSGTWTQHSGTVNFVVPADGSSSNATWNGTKLTIVQDGSAYVYTKQ